ncbi:hypothetical protein DESC_500134 [Desulfosarcina cetonica]|nr:hypothetical protein DESC_500134 [Desulfosarcina cetonica]
MVFSQGHAHRVAGPEPGPGSGLGIDVLEIDIGRHLEFPRRFPLGGLFHELCPDGSRAPPAGDADAALIVHALPLVKAHPDRGTDGGGEAGEPGVTEIVGRSGLAGGRQGKSHAPDHIARAPVDHAGHHVHQLVGHRLVEHPFAGDDVLFQHLAVDILNPTNPERHMADPARGESGIGRSHLQGADPRSPQGHRIDRLEGAADAAPAGRLDHGRGSQFLHQLGGHGVDRFGKSPLHDQGAFMAAFKIARTPRRLALDGDGDRPVLHHIGRRFVEVFHHAVIEKGLESGAGLAIVLQGPIVRRLEEITSADQGLDRTGGHIHTHQGALQAVIVILSRRIRGFIDFHVLFKPADAFLQSGLGELLQTDIQRGEYPQTAMVDHFRGEFLLQRLHHGIQEITVHAHGAGLFAQFQRCRSGIGGLLRGDHAGFHHALEHHFLAGLGPFQITERVVARGGFGQTRQKGRFRQGQFAGGLVEKGPCRFTDAISTHAKGDLVDIGLQNLLFGKLGLDLEGNQQFPEFPGVGAFETEEEVLGQLLGDAGGPLHLARFEQGHIQRLEGSQFVHSVVIPKTVVLGGQDRLHENIGNILQGHGLPAANGQDPTAVGAKNLRGRRIVDPADGIRHLGKIPDRYQEEAKYPQRGDGCQCQQGIEHRQRKTDKAHGQCHRLSLGNGIQGRCRRFFGCWAGSSGWVDADGEKELPKIETEDCGTVGEGLASRGSSSTRTCQTAHSCPITVVI